MSGELRRAGAFIGMSVVSVIFSASYAISTEGEDDCYLGDQLTSCPSAEASRVFVAGVKTCIPLIVTCWALSEAYIQLNKKNDEAPVRLRSPSLPG